jgi:hypothetical protein
MKEFPWLQMKKCMELVAESMTDALSLAELTKLIQVQGSAYSKGSGPGWRFVPSRALQTACSASAHPRVQRLHTHVLSARPSHVHTHSVRRGRTITASMAATAASALRACGRGLRR